MDIDTKNLKWNTGPIPEALDNEPLILDVHYVGPTNINPIRAQFIESPRKEKFVQGMDRVNESWTIVRWAQKYPASHGPDICLASLRGAQDMLGSIRTSLKNFPDSGCDVEISREVTRIASACFDEGLEWYGNYQKTGSGSHPCPLMDAINKKGEF